MPGDWMNDGGRFPAKWRLCGCLSRLSVMSFLGHPVRTMARILLHTDAAPKTLHVIYRGIAIFRGSPVVVSQQF